MIYELISFNKNLLNNGVVAAHGFHHVDASFGSANAE